MLLRGLLILPGVIAALALLGIGCNTSTPSRLDEGSSSSSSPVQQIQAIKDTILTPDDFNGYTAERQGLARPHEKEETYHVQLRPDLPLYTFHIVSTSSSGIIEIFHDPEKTKPLQIIQLDPNRWLSDESAFFFNVADITFDGYPDIGTIVDGGSKWATYDYWAFDPKTGMFIQNTLTQDMRHISFNVIKIDTENRQLVTENFIGGITGGSRAVYKPEKGHLLIQKEVRQQNTVLEEASSTANTPPIIHCQTKYITYRQGKRFTSHKQELNHECEALPENF